MTTYFYGQFLLLSWKVRVSAAPQELVLSLILVTSIKKYTDAPLRQSTAKFFLTKVNIASTNNPLQSLLPQHLTPLPYLPSIALSTTGLYHQLPLHFSIWISCRLPSDRSALLEIVRDPLLTKLLGIYLSHYYSSSLAYYRSLQASRGQVHDSEVAQEIRVVDAKVRVWM